jgi:hypothetical protein
VRVVTQYASADLIEAVVYRGHPPADDPQWRSTGAVSRDDYATWCGHICGMACLAMVLGHRDSDDRPSLFALLRQGLPYGTYQVGGDGRIRGLFYAPFADYIRNEHGLDGEVRAVLSSEDLVRFAAEPDAFVVASVNKEIRRPHLPAPGRGGHLVLVHDADPACGQVAFCNPSGHTPQARQARLPVTRFEPFFAGRGVVVRLRRRR